MPLFFEQRASDRNGTLEVKHVDSDFVEVYFVPSDENLLEAGLDPKQGARYRAKLLDIPGR